MPLAKLSERFYRTFGHDLVDELVGWLNQMDTTYRTDLRELNELNFARFDAKLEQRAAELGAKLEQRIADLEVKVEQRIADLEVKVEKRITGLDAKLEKCIGEVKSELHDAVARLREEFAEKLQAQTSKLVLRMLGIWIAAVPTLAGVVVLVEHLLSAGRR